jgi:hypothetical protein
MKLEVELTKEELQAFSEILESDDDYDLDDLHRKAFNKVYNVVVNSLLKLK